MTFSATYSASKPARGEIDQIVGPVVLEFGSPTCGYCHAAQAAIGSAFSGHPDVRHIKIADGSGRRLGRSFGVKLWPTLVFMKGGKEVARLVRPGDAAPIRDALRRIDAG